MHKYKRRPIAEMNVVPYIDVMLVLLVIFMITAPILTQGVKVDLPKVSTEPLKTPKQEEPMIVTVTANGRYIIERGKSENIAVSLSQVQDYAGKILKTAPTTQVLVRGDKAASYGKIIELMSTLQAAGAGTVGLVTEAPEPGK